MHAAAEACMHARTLCITRLGGMRGNAAPGVIHDAARLRCAAVPAHLRGQRHVLIWQRLLLCAGLRLMGRHNVHHAISLHPAATRQISLFLHTIINTWSDTLSS